MKIYKISFLNLPIDISSYIVSQLPAQEQYITVNRFFMSIIRKKLTKEVKTIQRWYRNHRLDSPPPYPSLLTRWTLIRYCIAKFPTKNSRPDLL